MANDTDRDPLDELAESFVERYRRGERPALSEYTRKHPQYAQRIEKLFPALVMMEELAPDDDPESGAPGAAAMAGLDQLDDFQILREVGRGGMGIVYEAMQESLGRHVALKVLPFHGLMDQSHLKRFQREARAAARLHHTHIVPVFEVGEHDQIHYYAMQFIRGQGLDEVLAELIAMRGKLPSPPAALSAQIPAAETSSEIGADVDASSASSASLPGRSGLSGSTAQDQHYYRSVARIGAQAADALAYAHDEGILHRDVKPSNLMLDTEGKIWVTDFGLAKTDAKEDLTHTGDLVGTLRYMAPERFDGWSDPRSDVYGLGLTLYELLTLRPAYDDSDRVRLIKRITHDEPSRPRRVNRSIPPDLETIVLKSIAKEPGERYQSAAHLADDLRRFFNQEPIKARRTSLLERTRMWRRRNPLAAGLALAIVGLSLAVSVGATLSAVWLRSERNQALAHSQRAENAEQTATIAAARQREARLQAQRSLYHARLAQARAGRWSGRMGRRFEGLAAIREAADLARELELGDDAMLQLRSEAIACMAMMDLRIDKTWPLWPMDNPPPIRGATFDANIERYAWLDPSGDFVVRRVEDNAELARLPVFGDPESGGLFMRFSPDGRYFAAKKGNGAQGVQIVVWNLQTGQEVFRTKAGGKTFYPNFDIDPSGLIAFQSGAGDIGVHDLSASKTLPPIRCPKPSICVKFARDGRRLAAVEAVAENAPGRVRIIDMTRREVMQTLELDRRVDTAAWGPDGKTLATPCYDGCIYIWDVVTGRQLQVCASHDAPARLVDYSPAGDLLVSMASEPSNRVWDPRSGRQLLQTEQALKSFSADGRWLGSSNRDRFAGPVRLEVATGSECRTLVGHAPDSEVVGLSFGLDGRLLVSVTKRDNIRFWDVAAARELGAIETKGLCRAVNFDRSGRSFVALSNYATVWPLETEASAGQRIVRIGPPDLVAGSRIDWNEQASPVDSATIIALPSLRGEIVFVKVDDPSQPTVLRTGYLGRSVTVSPNGKWFATGERNRPQIEIRNMTTGEVVKQIAALNGSHVQFSPDGKWLVGSLNGGQIVFWHVDSWRESHRFRLEGRGFSRFAFSQDCRLMAVTDSFHVTLLRPDSGREIARLSSPHREQLSQTVADSASGIAFSPDDGILAVGSDDGSIQLWDLRLVRRQLADMGLDWDAPPLRPVLSPETSTEIVIESAGADLWEKFERLALLSQFLDENPNHFDALTNRVRMLWQLQKYEAMIADAGRMIELRPEEHDGYAWRAFPLMMLERYEEAIRDYQKSLSINPKNPWPMRHLAWMRLTGPEHLRDWKRARELAEESVKQKADPLFLTTLGAVCFREKEYETAKERLQKAARSSGGDVQAVRLLFLALSHHHLAETDESRRSYESALEHLDKPVSQRFFRREEIETLRAEAESLLAADEK